MAVTALPCMFREIKGTRLSSSFHGWETFFFFLEPKQVLLSKGGFIYIARNRNLSVTRSIACKRREWLKRIPWNSRCSSRSGLPDRVLVIEILCLYSLFHISRSSEGPKPANHQQKLKFQIKPQISRCKGHFLHLSSLGARTSGTARKDSLHHCHERCYCYPLWSHWVLDRRCRSRCHGR